MAIVLLIPMRSKFPGPALRVQKNARDLGDGELVQEPAAHGCNVAVDRRLVNPPQARLRGVSARSR
jgi:hypothetical protein